jgi:hypothetical protein
MSDPYYPNLAEGTILPFKAAVAQMQQHSDYLSRADCPYPTPVRDFLRQLGAQKVVGAVSEYELADDKNEFLDREIARVMQDLTDLYAGLNSGDANEKLQILKARAGLVEKLVTSRERVLSMRDIANFQVSVIGFLEDACTKDQITELKRRLRIEEPTS